MWVLTENLFAILYCQFLFPFVSLSVVDALVSFSLLHNCVKDLHCAPNLQ